MNIILQSATEPQTVQNTTERITCILDASHNTASRVEIVGLNYKCLSKETCNKILKLLIQYRDLFESTLDDFYTESEHLNLKKYAISKHHEVFTGPQIYENTLKNALNRQYKIGVVRKCSDSTWVSHKFIIPKKNGTGGWGNFKVIP